MKKKLQLITLLLLLPIVSMLSAEKSKAKNKLTVVFPHIHYNKEWDIAKSGSLWSYFINNNIVEPLIRLGAKTEYLPAIAKSW